MNEAKPFKVEKRLIYEGWKEVKSNKGSAGIDDIEIEEYEDKLGSNLYKLWNRMSSGSYFPKPVKLVEIPKSNGGKRPLGIPTVEDRIAQAAVVKAMMPELDKIFHEDSYGFRPNKSAHDAIAKADERCWRYSWVLDMDISKFFDTIDHELLMRAVRRHVTERWMLLYIERWLKVPYQMKDGTIIERAMGVPQGSVIGPVLANLFLHYVFDKWMQKNYPTIPFERYADDSICHCVSRKQAEFIRNRLIERFAQCKLKLNEEKTKIVYCKDSNRKGRYENESFDYLGFTFRPRAALNKRTYQVFTAFKPAISKKASKKIREEIQSWRILQNYHYRLEDIAHQINPVVRGWINYYSKFGKTEFREVMGYLNRTLANWVRKKYKRLKRSRHKAHLFLVQIANCNRALFSHWVAGYVPYRTGRWNAI